MQRGRCVCGLRIQESWENLGELLPGLPPQANLPGVINICPRSEGSGIGLQRIPRSPGAGCPRAPAWHPKCPRGGRPRRSPSQGWRASAGALQILHYKNSLGAATTAAGKEGKEEGRSKAEPRGQPSRESGGHPGR